MREQEIFQKVFAVASELSVKIYAVGGYVRDELLSPNTPKKDIDFVVTGPAGGLDFARAFTLKLNGTLEEDRKSTRLNSSHSDRSHMPSSA